MANFGVRIAAKGKDVSSSSAKDILLRSDFPTPKVDLRASPPRYGIINFHFNAEPPAGVDTLLYAIPHQRGYVPMHIIFLANSPYLATDNFQIVALLPGFLASDVSIFTKADTTSIYFYVAGGSSSVAGLTGIVRYAIYSQPIAAA